MKLRLTSLVLLLALLGTFVAMPRSAAAASPKDLGGTVAVSGTAQSGVNLGTFTGTISNLVFSVNQAGQLVVSGVLNGTAMVGGVAIPVVNQAFTVVADLLDPGGAPCKILELDIGAIHLNLLGLVIDIAPIHIDVTAQPGPGNLLGNLLCGLAHLLDRDGTLAQLLRLVNRINALL